MQKILILIGYQPEDGPTAALYLQYAQPGQQVTVRRLDTFFVCWDGNNLVVSDSRDEVGLDDFDVVHFAGWQTEPDLGGAFAMLLDRIKKPYIGHTLRDLYPSSKVGEMLRLVQAGVPYPKSFYTANNDRLGELFDWAHEHYGIDYPVVVKASAASKGDDNHLVCSRTELDALELNPASRYLMQEAIPNDCDYRVLVMGGKIVMTIRRTRTNPDTHLNNTAQGARADIVAPEELPSALSDTVIAATRALGREDIAGVDVLIDKRQNDMYVLEVNKTPHLALGGESVIESKIRALYVYLGSL